MWKNSNIPGYNVHPDSRYASLLSNTYNNVHPDSRYASLLSNTYTETKKPKKCYAKTFTLDLDAIMWDNSEPNNKQIKISQEAIRIPINTNYSVSSP